MKTKMVCTLGPASSSPEVIREIVDGGVHMVRINMSHGSHEEHRRIVKTVRDAAAASDPPVALLFDLAGPKIRVGDLEHPLDLGGGAQVVMAPQADASGDEIPTTYPELARDLSPGDRVLLDDGLLELECVETSGDRAHLRVVRGGTLQRRKGINLPGVRVSAPSLTEKDRADLELALELGADYVGLSFVRRGEDVAELRRLVDGRALVVAKIEKAEALDGMEGILRETDAVMVARGDLGVELPFQQVPLAQKRIIELANFWGRPVITATQMLESMIEHPRPTRAEASDVANAILDGTDAVMLSGETAVGRYPVHALGAMRGIIEEVESSGALRGGPRYSLVGVQQERLGATPREHAVASSTVASARQLDSPAILVITRSGFSARLVSSYRPPVPIYAICTDARTFSQLSATWGVHPLLSRLEEVTYEGLTEFGMWQLLERGVGRPGDAVPVTAGYPFHTSGTTNTMRVEVL
jgi:pyruvate kinase